MSEIVSQVDDPQIIDAPDGVSIDRWTKYGHDRLYINGARIEPYVDLKDGSVNETGRVRVSSDIDSDTITIEIGMEGGESAHQIIVISLSGNADENDSNTDNAEPTAEHIEEVGYTKAAGQAQQHEAMRLADDDDLMTDGGKTASRELTCDPCGKVVAVKYYSQDGTETIEWKSDEHKHDINPINQVRCFILEESDQ